jgi:hypothetical protein
VVKQEEIACIVLGMPFSTMSQTVLEVAFYSPWMYVRGRGGGRVRAKRAQKKEVVGVLRERSECARARRAHASEATAREEGGWRSRPLFPYLTRAVVGVGRWCAA